MAWRSTKRRLRVQNPERMERAERGSQSIASTLAEITRTRFPRQFSELSAALAFACAEQFKADSDPSAQIEQLLVDLGYRGVFLTGDSVVECTPAITLPVFLSMDLTRFLLASLGPLDKYTAAQLARGSPTGIVLYLYRRQSLPL
jgi:hypothetical protein